MCTALLNITRSDDQCYNHHVIPPCTVKSPGLTTSGLYLADDFIADDIFCYKCIASSSSCLHSHLAYILQDSSRQNTLVLSNCCYSNIYDFLSEILMKCLRKIMYLTLYFCFKYSIYWPLKWYMSLSVFTICLIPQTLRQRLV